MQQTEIYKLNKPNFYTDMFSPDPLNENMEKLEAALSAEAQARQTAVSAEAEARAAETAARQAADAAEAQARTQADTAEAQARTQADAALDQRIQVLELHRIVYGTYTGNGQSAGDSQFVGLPFTPAAVFISDIRRFSYAAGIALTDLPYGKLIEIQPGGFKVTTLISTNVNDSANSLNQVYRYIAFC